jgi:RimJ/RimL family protein N-acetyltransferase
MNIGPTLTTKRLVLRPPIHADFDAWAAMSEEGETMRFIGGVSERDAAWRGLAMMAGSWAILGYGMFSVIEKESGRWIGRIGPWRPGGKEGGWPGDEVGWGLIAAAQGKGYAYEAAEASMQWAFDHLGWDEVIHCIDQHNAPSIALAHRLGSTLLRKDRIPPPYDLEIDIYGQTAAQWRARPRA